MRCFVCGEKASCRETKQVANSLHRVRVCGCGNRFLTVEMPYVRNPTPRQRAALSRIAAVQREKALPAWAVKAANDVMRGVGWAEAAARQGKTEWALRKLFADEEKTAERNRKRAAARRRRLAGMTPEARREKRQLEALRVQARAEAKEKGVPYTEVYKAWGLLKE